MRPTPSRRQLLADAALAVMFAASGQVQLFVPNDDGYFGGPLAMNVAIMLATALPLAARRIRPTTVAGIVFGVHIAASLLVPHTVTFWGSILPMTIALYSVARWAEPRFVVPSLGLPVAFTATYGIHVPSFGRWDDHFFTALLMGTAWVAGRVISRLQTQREALNDALARLEGQQEERHRQVLLEERTRIAREMHDVVAHGVSVMVVQAGSARLELDEHDTAARESLLAVERTGRDVLEELRRTVSLLRTDEGPSNGRPAPGFAEISGLVEAMRTAGLDIDLRLDVAKTSDPGRGLAVYRIVQEALTNVLRHAGPTSVQVRVTGDPDLRVEVVDAGRRSGGSVAPSLERGGGNGLVGMRERVGMYGGRLDVQEQETGFALRADIPAPEPSR